MTAGLRAFIYGPDLADAELEPPTAAAISAWADGDADLGHLDGCYCGCARPPMPAEACTELGAGTAPPRPGLLRRLHIALIKRRLDIVRDERDRYAHAGVIGPTYHRNSLVLQLQLMARIRELGDHA